jgi:antitoxin HicB
LPPSIQLAGSVRIANMPSQASLANYKIILYAQEGGGWVADIPAIGGCYALMGTREEALQELESVFRMIQEEYAESGKPLPVDRTELLMHA